MRNRNIQLTWWDGDKQDNGPVWYTNIPKDLLEDIIKRVKIAEDHNCQMVKDAIEEIGYFAEEVTVWKIEF